MKFKSYKNAPVRKRFGQNFLTDNNILEEIAEKSGFTSDDFVLEIGPGHGALTEKLLNRAKQVVAVEIDWDLVESLKNKFQDEKRLEIVSQDILDFDFASLPLEQFPFEKRKAIGNIPYYITTPIIMKVIGEESLKNFGISKTNQVFSELVIMLQKEVGDRIMASPGTKEYGAISVICQYACTITPLMTVGRKSFYPVPKVDSMIIKLNLKTEDEYHLEKPQILWRLVHGVFTSRRKTLRNSLKIASFTQEQIKDLENNYNLDVRGETMSIAEFAKVSNLLFQSEKNTKLIDN